VIVPFPLFGVVKPIRFFLLELPRERERNRLAQRDERIEFVLRHGLARDNRDPVVTLLAEGKSMRRALKARDAEASERRSQPVAENRVITRRVSG
jgi:hypothetical protein